MNVFVLDTEPEIAARMHCDKHVIKMILESVQLLSTAVRSTGIDAGYKATHANHPCAKWARESITNWMWIWRLAQALNREYRYRYGRDVDHASIGVLWRLPIPPLPNLGLTPFALAMPRQYRSGDPVESYRAYYIGEKARFATWRKRGKPDWFGVDAAGR